MKVRFQVHGLVQGVGFRWYTARAAQGQKVKGWIRNHTDGSVIGEAEGDVYGLATLQACLQRGPSRSSVRQLDWEEYEGDTQLPDPFEIRS